MTGPARPALVAPTPPIPRRRIPYAGLFVEAEYADGRPYAETAEDEAEPDTTT